MKTYHADYISSFQFKKLSKVVKEDEPQPSTSNISLNDELEIIPSTSTLTTTITPVDEDITGAIGQDHLNDYNEFMMMNNEQEREQEESDVDDDENMMMNNEQEPEEESDGDDSENIEIPDFFLNPKNLKGKIKCSLHFFSADLICIDYEEEVGGNKSENEALFMNSLMASELKTFYYDFFIGYKLNAISRKHQHAVYHKIGANDYQTLFGCFAK
uniref:Uncharacterized protein LOC113793717 isoform X1 n=1 Tax=Dermatophagoides pteronyssinus TaxID=6956 RepID=A0A6P6Y2U4_DERPT|nr:uncharacterized protein LOC113793717 isoform X1 [Dermatophagoides pteronyssinus]